MKALYIFSLISVCYTSAFAGTCNLPNMDISTLIDTSSPGESNVASKKIIPHLDFEYLGAFTTPELDEFSIPYGGGTYYKNGDPNNVDGDIDAGGKPEFPGSLFVTGSLKNRTFAEISIPKPQIRSDKNWQLLPKATVLQKPSEITEGWTWYVNGQAPGSFTDNTTWSTKDVLVVGPDEGLPQEHLLWIMSKEYTEGPYENNVNPLTGKKDIPIMLLGSCDIKFDDSDGINSRGHWRLTPDFPSLYAAYLFKIPQWWADKNSKGKTIIAGQNRNSIEGSQGITMHAFSFAPESFPPPDKTILPSESLLQYTNGVDDYDTSGMMNYYMTANTPGDGTWVSIGNKNAIVFLTTHAERNRVGDTRYDCIPQYIYGTPPLDMSFANEAKGFTGGPYQYALLFFDPEYIAKYKPGSFQPEPYAMMQLGEYAFSATNSGKNIKGQISYDETNNLLYVEEIPELTATAARSVFHVFRLKDKGTNLDRTPPTTPSNLQITSVSSSAISISFEPGNDLETKTWHVILRNGFPISYIEPGKTTFTDTFVGAWRERGVNNFLYKVSAFDTNVNYSGWSNTVMHQFENDDYSDIVYYHDCESFGNAQIAGGDPKVYPEVNGHIRHNITPVLEHGSWAQHEYSMKPDIGVHIPIQGNMNLEHGRLGFSASQIAGSAGFGSEAPRPAVSTNNNEDDFSVIVTAYDPATSSGSVRVAYRGISETYSLPFRYDDIDGLLHMEFKFENNSCTTFIGGIEAGTITSSQPFTATELIFLKYKEQVPVSKCAIDGIMFSSDLNRNLYKIRGETNIVTNIN